VNAEAAAEPNPRSRGSKNISEHTARCMRRQPASRWTPFYFESQTFPESHRPCNPAAEAARTQLSAGIPISQVFSKADPLPFGSPGQLVNRTPRSPLLRPRQCRLFGTNHPRGRRRAAHAARGNGILFLFLKPEGAPRNSEA